MDEKYCFYIELRFLIRCINHNYSNDHVHNQVPKVKLGSVMVILQNSYWDWHFALLLSTNSPSYPIKNRRRNANISIQTEVMTIYIPKKGPNFALWRCAPKTCICQHGQIPEKNLLFVSCSFFLSRYGCIFSILDACRVILHSFKNIFLNL